MDMDKNGDVLIGLFKFLMSLSSRGAIEICDKSFEEEVSSRVWGEQWQKLAPSAQSDWHNQSVIVKYYTEHNNLMLKGIDLGMDKAFILYYSIFHPFRICLKWFAL